MVDALQGHRRRRDRLPDRLRRRHRARCSRTCRTSSELMDKLGAAARRRGRDATLGRGSMIAQHGVTHLQCTPSMARMLRGGRAGRATALARLRCDDGRRRGASRSTLRARCAPSWAATAHQHVRADRDHDLVDRRTPSTRSTTRCRSAGRSPTPGCRASDDRHWSRAGRRAGRAVHRRRRRGARLPTAARADRRALRARPFRDAGARMYRTGDLARRRRTAGSSSSAASTTR